MKRQLYTYWRSSCSYRVRIALNLKEVEYESVPVHLVRNGGEQRARSYLARNPQGLVPSYDDDGVVVNQSLAIIEYLEERHPWPPLLPVESHDRACVRNLAYQIACDISPLNNLRVLGYLSGPAGLDDNAKNAWYRHWIAAGFDALERSLADGRTGAFCHGDQPTMADVCLVPQVYNALRFECDMEPFPVIRRINDACLALPAFDEARPEIQPDAVLSG